MGLGLFIIVLTTTVPLLHTPALSCLHLHALPASPTCTATHHMPMHLPPHHLLLLHLLLPTTCLPKRLFVLGGLGGGVICIYYYTPHRSSPAGFIVVVVVVIYPTHTVVLLCLFPFLLCCAPLPYYISHTHVAVWLPAVSLCHSLSSLLFPWPLFPIPFPSCLPPLPSLEHLPILPSTLPVVTHTFSVACRLGISCWLFLMFCCCCLCVIHIPPTFPVLTYLPFILFIPLTYTHVCCFAALVVTLHCLCSLFIPHLLFLL